MLLKWGMKPCGGQNKTALFTQRHGDMPGGIKGPVIPRAQQYITIYTNNFWIFRC